MVIGSIDLMGGKVVQLKQGRDKVLEFDDALSRAKEFNKYNEIAVIDLDAAMGKGENLNLIKDLLKVADCRVGGGIRSIEKAKELILAGANKIIIGSRAFEKKNINHKFLTALKKEIGQERIIIALDTFNNRVVVSGWQEHTDIELFDVIKEFESYTNEFLFTFVETEGMMQGIDIEKAKAIREKTDKKITVAGGVSSLNEVKILAEMDIDVQLGMGLYTKRISLVDAFIESLNWKSELIPTITQDISGLVLMLAYSNKESLRKTFETGKMWYFSRSRKELWFKGKTSGNFQEVIKLRADCDRDGILALVRQRGVACHTGNLSCFNIRRVYE
uniref:Histidine biosynthesis bifunctional protein HisIE n=1 Tax=candidate division WOR-3 bacterium TaxID=2052148 RepID=A0A7V1EIW3_UNCW3